MFRTNISKYLNNNCTREKNDTSYNVTYEAAHSYDDWLNENKNIIVSNSNNMQTW